MPYYVVGDYYGRGDYYRGDGLFSFLGKAAKAALPFVPVIGGPLSAGLTARSALQKAGVPLPSPSVPSLPAPVVQLAGNALTTAVASPGTGIPIPTLGAAAPPGVPAPDSQGIVWIGGKPYSPGGTPLDPGKVAAAGAPKIVPVQTPGGTVMVHVGKKYRRMNWANGRALGRAERRISSAVKHMSKYIRWVHPKKDGHAAPKFGRKKK